MEKYFHSVTLLSQLCKGCTNCVRRCPTGAIRVRYGKAIIIKERCIDCGECIRVCPHYAKQATVSPLTAMDNYKYKIALPAPSLYAQFNNLEEIDPVFNALIDFGFDDVYEVAKAAEIVSASTRHLMANGNLIRPVISSACPAVLRLISVRFPNLIENILPLKSPAQFAGLEAKKIAMEKTGLSFEEIGTIFISPCPAKVTAAKSPLCSNRSAIDEVVAIRDIYPKLLPLMKKSLPEEKINSTAGRVGIGWGTSGGESSAILSDNYLAADGMENVIRVLEDLEDDKLPNLEFVELNACSGGCVGGVLTVENPFIAKTKLKLLRKYCPISCNHIENQIPDGLCNDKNIEYLPVLRLDQDISVASKKLKQMEEIESQLYGLDCGSCGAPSCRGLAEDIVRGFATEDYCVYKLASKLSSKGGDAINPLPIAFRTKEAIEKLSHIKEYEKNEDR